MHKAARIRELNDAFRTTFTGGKVMLSSGVAEMEPKDRAKLLEKVRTFSAFNIGNDPHQEHDFVGVEQDGETYFAKIDYYAQDLMHGSEDPSDPAQTLRVLTIMRADEY